MVPASATVLNFIQVVKDGVGGVDGLAGTISVTVSPDGSHLYAASQFDNAVAVFSRSASTGALTFVEMQKDSVGGVDGLNGASSTLQAVLTTRWRSSAATLRRGR